VGPFVPVIEIDEPTSLRLRAEVPVLERHSLAELGFTRLETIEATSCKNLLWHADATRENAVDQLRYQAEQLGANAVADVRCDPMEDTSYDKNCWNSVTCRGEAIRVR
jgi:uncharacterized protein YbjQ (UPF0145 family)